MEYVIGVIAGIVVGVSLGWFLWAETRADRIRREEEGKV